MNLLRENLCPLLAPDLVEEVITLFGHRYRRFPTRSNGSFLLHPEGTKLFIRDITNLNKLEEYVVHLPSLRTRYWEGYPVAWDSKTRETVSQASSRALSITDGERTHRVAADLQGHISSLITTERGIFVIYFEGGARLFSYLRVQGPLPRLWTRKSWKENPLPLKWIPKETCQVVIRATIDPTGSILVLELGGVDGLEIRFFSLESGQVQERRPIYGKMFNERSHCHFSPKGEYFVYLQGGEPPNLVLRHLASDLDLVLETPRRSSLWPGLVIRY